MIQDDSEGAEVVFNLSSFLFLFFDFSGTKIKLGHVHKTYYVFK